MPKKITRAKIKAAAELTIKREGSIEKAIASFRDARQHAEDQGDQHGIKTYDQLIKYCNLKATA